MQLTYKETQFMAQTIVGHIGLFVAVVGMVILLFPDAKTSPLENAIMLGLMVLLAGVVALVFLWRLRIEVDGDFLTVRGIFKKTVINLREIEEVRMAEIGASHEHASQLFGLTFWQDRRRGIQWYNLAGKRYVMIKAGSQELNVGSRKSERLVSVLETARHK